MNKFPSASALTLKAELWTNFKRMQTLHGQKAFNYMPPTFILPREFEQFERLCSSELQVTAALAGCGVEEGVAGATEGASGARGGEGAAGVEGVGCMDSAGHALSVSGSRGWECAEGGRGAGMKGMDGVEGKGLGVIESDSTGGAWIVKPAAACRGKGITVHRMGSVLEGIREQRGVASRYVHPPYLIDGYKSDLRLYVLVSTKQGGVVNELQLAWS